MSKLEEENSSVASNNNKVLSFVSLNSFLIPWAITQLNSTHAASGVNQKERAIRIAAYLKDKDLIALQELWGSQVFTIQSVLEPSHWVSYRSTNIFGMFPNFLDGISFHLQSLGGLWFAHSRKVNELRKWKYTFSESRTKSKKGVSSLLLDVDQHWPGKKLLIFNTHLDPFPKQLQSKQIDEIYSFIGKCIGDIDSYNTKEGRIEVDLTQCGLILVGDFNIGAGSKLYQKIMGIEGVRDLFEESKKKFGLDGTEYSFDPTRNLIAHEYTGGATYRARIDHIFGIDSYGNQKFTPLQALDCKIETQEEGQELSDHYPIECNLLPQSDDSSNRPACQLT